jgi:hypothetical protein
MDKSICFFTVCGGHEDYEFLLGSIDHHSRLGVHLVLDTTPAPYARKFRNLPPTVVWVHEPIFGSGWKEFKFVSALERAQEHARARFRPEVLVQTDSDDFWTLEAVPLFELGRGACVETQYVHWLKDGEPYLYGESEWHRRIWPAYATVKVEKDTKWPFSPHYNGNPELHTRVTVPSHISLLRFDGLFRHHVHFALGKKAEEDEVAKGSITGWPHGKRLVDRRPWPDKLVMWNERGTLPSTFYA